MAASLLDLACTGRVALLAAAAYDLVSVLRPRVSFIVPTYRRPSALAVTLDALASLSWPETEIVVVDDGNQPEARRLVEARGLLYLAQDGLGAAAARNRGAAAATGDLLIFVDDDIVVEPDHVERHLAARTEAPGALVNGHWEFPPEFEETLSRSAFGRFRIEVEEWVKEGVPKERTAGEVSTVPTVTACNLSIERDDFVALGGFDESFPHAGAEDQELSIRAAADGHPLLYDRRIKLMHNDGRIEFRGFCERQRRGAISTVFLVAKHPHEAQRRAMIVENAPGVPGATWRARTKRRAKWLVARAPVRAAVHAVLGVMERVAPRSRWLQRAYWSLCGVYIFIGVREGFSALDPVSRRATLAKIDEVIRA